VSKHCIVNVEFLLLPVVNGRRAQPSRSVSLDLEGHEERRWVLAELCVVHLLQLLPAGSISNNNQL